MFFRAAEREGCCFSMEKVLTLVGEHEENFGICWEVRFGCPREEEVKKSLEKGKNRNIWYCGTVSGGQILLIQLVLVLFHYHNCERNEMKNRVCTGYDRGIFF